jgi:SOS response regulatory protein OraA/RecX
MHKETIEFEKAYESALTILDYSPQFSFILKIKLQKKNYPEDIINKVTERLIDNELINDEKNAKNYTLELINNKLYGINKIIFKLQEKGIKFRDAQNISQEMITSVGGENEIAIKYINKNILLIKKLLNDGDIDKIKNKLNSKGFTYQTINFIVKNLEDILSSF